jgi:serine/threonine-protein kinase
MPDLHPTNALTSKPTEILHETSPDGSFLMEFPSVPGASRTTVLPELAERDGQVGWVAGSRGRFRVDQLLGQGGAGEVLLARDEDIGRRVAIKKIRPDKLSGEALVRFIREIRTVGLLEHPNIVPIHDVGVDEDGNYYFIMKYVEGRTLEELIDRMREGDPEVLAEFPFERRVQIFYQLCEAVAFAHQRGIVHRDIKPANVMIGKYGEVVLMDWGIAKELQKPEAGKDAAAVGAALAAAVGAEKKRWFSTQVGTAVGTPAYMAPEQIMGRPADVRSDIYSLGVLLHELLTLVHYLDGKESIEELIEGVLHESPVVPTFLSKRRQCPVPADLNWFIDRCVQKKPERRYASVDEMLHRLDLRAQGIIPVQCPMTLVKRVTLATGRFSERHPIVTFALFFGALPATLGLAIWSILSR